MSDTEVDEIVEREIQWVKDYCSTFGFTSEPLLRGVGCWLVEFKENGFNIEAIEKVSKKVKERPPEGRSVFTSHYNALRRLLNEERKTQKRMEQAAFQDYRCQRDCFGGFIEVPHLSCVIEGEFVKHPYLKYKYKVVVACDCVKGKSSQSNINSYLMEKQLGNLMDILTYEHYNPNWCHQLAMEKYLQELHQKNLSDANLLDNIK